MTQHLTTDQSIYVHDDERFVAMLAVGYMPERDRVRTPEQAAFAALSLTQDDGWDGTHWLVLDRETGVVHEFEQESFAEWMDNGFVFVHDPLCTGCEHDCIWERIRNGAPDAIGSPWCAMCDDHMEAREAE